MLVQNLKEVDVHTVDVEAMSDLTPGSELL